MGMTNHPDPPIVSIEESTSAADKVFLDSKRAIRRHNDGNNDSSFPGSRGMSNTVRSEKLPHPIRYPNIAAYPEYGSHQLVSNNWITPKSGYWRLQNIEERLLE